MVSGYLLVVQRRQLQADKWLSSMGGGRIQKAAKAGRAANLQAGFKPRALAMHVPLG